VIGPASVLANLMAFSIMLATLLFSAILATLVALPLPPKSSNVLLTPYAKSIGMDTTPSKTASAISFAYIEFSF
jgi:hypothetical protein